MQIDQAVWTTADGWRPIASGGDAAPAAADLVVYFAAPGVADDPQRTLELAERWPGASIVGCTTGGEILGTEVLDGTMVATAVRFSTARVKTAISDIAKGAGAVGRDLAATLAAPDLRLVFVLSDGTQVNGAALVAGMRDAIDDGVVVTGGLAGDGADFGVTKVALNGPPQPGQVAAIGFYGPLSIGHGSYGGWTPFGPERLVTRSRGAVLFELDGQPALELYKRYLGEAAARLPGSALHFPLNISLGDGRQLTRTIVGIDEQAQSMTFAGDVPQGAVARLMRSSTDRLIEGAGRAAGQITAPSSGPKLALMVSCIGRKLTLGQRCGEEVEEVMRVLGADTSGIGFYSYGELSPHETGGFCELHNQTMTITVISEAAA
ncbi:MAG: hypothetical protein EAZ99_10715 [Alphaproteobacteria bacterium]|nr:MAG: hypothetical protein EAZ99_10715 [Alphaproteobacteria bacterium]